MKQQSEIERLRTELEAIGPCCPTCGTPLGEMTHQRADRMREKQNAPEFSFEIYADLFQNVGREQAIAMTNYVLAWRGLPAMTESEIERLKY